MERDKTNHELIKAATVGLIGDGVQVIELTDLYNRVGDQAARLGEYGPAWPAFCDAIDTLKGYQRVGRIVELPAT